VVGWNISMKVMLMPLAMAAMFFRTGIPVQYTECEVACGGVLTGDPLRLLSGQALGPLVKTRAFGMAP
jgi:hypothetical protein